MKVDGAPTGPIAVPARSQDQSPGQPFRQSPGGSPSQSFAEVLAAGKTVAEIKSQRALGFSETGLLGGSRAQPPAVLGTLKTRAMPSPELVGRSAASGLAKLPSRPPGPVARTAPLSNRSAEPGLQVVPDQAQARSTGFAPDRNTTKPVTQSRRNIVQTRTIAATLPNRQRRKRTDSLEIIGPDTALTVIVNDAGDEAASAALLLAFAQLASALGVTIESVVLDRRKIDFIKSIE